MPAPNLSVFSSTWRRLNSGRRALLWALLIALVLVGQAALWRMTWQHDNRLAQELTDAAAVTAASDLRQRISEDVQLLQELAWHTTPADQWRMHADSLMRERREVMRVDIRDSTFGSLELVESRYHGAQYRIVPREQMMLEAEVACTTAERFSVPAFSRSYFMPIDTGQGREVVDLCVPRQIDGKPAGFVLATIVLNDLLERAIPQDLARGYEIGLVEADGTRLARHGLRRGEGVYTAERLIDISGFTQALRLNSLAPAPAVLPSLSTALVLALSLALSAVLLLLMHDVRRRAAAEQRLAEELSFRHAMEDSLVTGLRAGDVTGRITYVNPAFCAMVGYSSEELIQAERPPYWPQDLLAEYTRRQAERRASVNAIREGFETTFVHRNGGRIPVMIFEAPLIDGRGQHAGWMSSVLNLSAQRRAEELSRQQLEKLQTAARLATMGEMATLLSHELNQPLAAIASYASGSLNLLPQDSSQPPVDLDTQYMLHQAMSRIAEQADRAGRVIRSVHQFVRRRERLRENVRASELIDAVMPLARLAARRSQALIEVDIPNPSPRVSCDRTMVEQVLLNLARNGLQAMEHSDGSASKDAVLTLRVRTVDARWVEFSVIDRGPGVPADVAQQLFTPFFSTKPEGMGIGLAMCRTVVEQHGGALDFTSPLGKSGSLFRFTLPVAQQGTHTPLPADTESPAHLH